MKKNKELCRYCKWYVPLGKEYSGLDTWWYTIGKCTNPKSVHGGLQNKNGNITYGNPSRETLPDWCKCWLFKKIKNKCKKDLTNTIPGIIL